MSDGGEVIELEAGGELGLSFDDEEGGATLTFEADDTVLDALVERDEDEGKARIQLKLSEDDVLWLWDLIREQKELT